MTVTVDPSGRVLIPKPLRDRLGFAPGAELVLDVHESGDGAPTLELRAAPEETTLVRENGRLVYTGEIDGDVDIVERLREQREARARRHGGLGRDPE